MDCIGLEINPGILHIKRMLVQSYFARYLSVKNSSSSWFGPRVPPKSNPISLKAPAINEVLPRGDPSTIIVLFFLFCEGPNVMHDFLSTLFDKVGASVLILFIATVDHLFLYSALAID